MIVFITAAETERLVLELAIARTPKGFEQVVALHPDLVLAARYSKLEPRELIERSNAAAEAGVTGHGMISPEFILESEPGAFVLGSGYERDRGLRRRLLADPRLAPLAAIRGKRILELPSRQLLTVSHHLAGSVLALADAAEALDF